MTNRYKTRPDIKSVIKTVISIV